MASWINALLGGVGGFAGGGIPGAAIGAGLGSGLLGDPGAQEYKEGLRSRYSPEIQKQFNDIMGNILKQYKDKKFDFDPIEEQARAGFSQKTLPAIAERFTSMGAGGGRSSGFANTLGQAGVDLERMLSSQKQQYGLQQQNLLQNLLSLGQQGPYSQARTPGLFENTLTAALPALLSGLGRGGGF